MRRCAVRGVRGRACRLKGSAVAVTLWPQKDEERAHEKGGDAGVTDLPAFSFPRPPQATALDGAG